MGSVSPSRGSDLGIGSSTCCPRCADLRAARHGTRVRRPCCLGVKRCVVEAPRWPEAELQTMRSIVLRTPSIPAARPVWPCDPRRRRRRCRGRHRDPWTRRSPPTSRRALAALSDISFLLPKHLVELAPRSTDRACRLGRSRPAVTNRTGPQRRGMVRGMKCRRPGSAGAAGGARGEGESQVGATVAAILRPFNPRVVGSSPTGPTTHLAFRDPDKGRPAGAVRCVPRPVRRRREVRPSARTGPRLPLHLRRHRRPPGRRLDRRGCRSAASPTLLP
jgi:hypothetical protein